MTIQPPFPVEQAATGLQPYRVSAHGMTLAGLFLRLLCMLLVGYALLGRGFAGTAVGPIFIGDAVLLFGLFVALFSSTWSRLLSLPLAWVLLGFIAWGAIRTVPFIPTFGRDALRDGVMWAYGGFALTVALVLLSRPERMERFVSLYGRYVILFGAVGTAFFVLQNVLGTRMPSFPGTTFGLVALRNGEVMVQAAGIAAFVLLGLRRGVAPLMMLAPIMAIAFATSRGATLAFLLALLVCLTMGRERQRGWAIIAGLLLFALLLLAVASVVMPQLPSATRTLSVDQFVSNLLSIFGASSSVDLLGTAQWRIYWWDVLMSDAMSARYFLDGKGYGPNLTDIVGAEYDVENLRSPHNFHLNILARSGMIGFALWFVLQLGWAIAVYRAYRVARARGLEIWWRLFLWLLAWWVAFMVNAGFDVFLEGPMGAAWFWTMFGLGLAALWTFRHRRDEVFRS